MDHNSSLLTKFWGWIAYMFSGGLVVGDAMDWINNNAGVIGAGLGVASLLINWYYLHKGSKKSISCE